uniref:Uncharacterized protein n=1 Tax=Arundo donax TaxID=35708 RepID=A0A0A8ZMF9_ARUDO
MPINNAVQICLQTVNISCLGKKNDTTDS